jgi:hypothetical protein
LDRLEDRVNRFRVPVTFAHMLYTLRDAVSGPGGFCSQPVARLAAQSASFLVVLQQRPGRVAVRRLFALPRFLRQRHSESDV